MDVSFEKSLKQVQESLTGSGKAEDCIILIFNDNLEFYVIRLHSDVCDGLDLKYLSQGKYVNNATISKK